MPKTRKAVNVSYPLDATRVEWSGREDLNLRPPAPKAGALPDCATPRLPARTSVQQLYRLSCSPAHASRGERRLPLARGVGVEHELERVAVRAQPKSLSIHGLASRRLVVILHFFDVLELERGVEIRILVTDDVGAEREGDGNALQTFDEIRAADQSRRCASLGHHLVDLIPRSHPQIQPDQWSQNDEPYDRDGGQSHLGPPGVVL